MFRFVDGTLAPDWRGRRSLVCHDLVCGGDRAPYLAHDRTRPALTCGASSTVSWNDKAEGQGSVGDQRVAWRRADRVTASEQGLFQAVWTPRSGERPAAFALTDPKGLPHHVIGSARAREHTLFPELRQAGWRRRITMPHSRTRQRAQICKLYTGESLTVAGHRLAETGRDQPLIPAAVSGQVALETRLPVAWGCCDYSPRVAMTFVGGPGGTSELAPSCDRFGWVRMK